MNKLIDEFIRLSMEHGDALQNGEDSKWANRIHSKTQKIVDRIQKSDSQTKEEFYKLLSHTNPSVKCWTAIELIGTEEQASLRALSDVSSEKGIVGGIATLLIDAFSRGMIKKNNWKKTTP